VLPTPRKFSAATAARGFDSSDSKAKIGPIG
jgi:hypothetical protein